MISTKLYEEQSVAEARRKLEEGNMADDHNFGKHLIGSERSKPVLSSRVE